MARTVAVNMLALSEMAYLFHVRSYTASALQRTLPHGNPVALAVSVRLVLPHIQLEMPPSGD